MAKPVVALVGRPNVGKSTLFNRLTGERLAIVDDVPGTTRDRLLSEADWTGHYFYVMDTGGIDPSKNRNQAPLSTGSKEFINQIRDQAELAMQESDRILFLGDGQVGVTPADHEIANILRRKQREVDGKLVPQPIEDAEHVDARRAAVGMMRMAEYDRVMQANYRPTPKPATPGKPD
jgi:GTP-binding protein